MYQAASTSPDLIFALAPELDFADLHEEHPCPACGGPPTVLGLLGRRLHLRCRCCGIEFSLAVEMEA